METASTNKSALNGGWVYRNQIDRAGETVLEFYCRRYSHSSRAEWQQRIDQGQVLLDERETAAQIRLQPGQQLTYHRPPWQEPDVPIDFTVLHEDDDLLVVVKPSGLPVLPGGGFLEHTLLWQLQQRYPDAAPIHRLGRGTSGLMLLARSRSVSEAQSPHARSILSQQMRDRKIRKVYRALASGSGMRDCFTVTQPIGKVAYPTLGYLYAATPDGLPAQSDCCVVKRGDRTTLLDVTILTGRPHQIRIHLAAAGYPLWGDRLYGAGGLPLPDLVSPTEKLPVPGDCGYFLHAMHLELIHPNGKPLSFTAPPPPELRV